MPQRHHYMLPTFHINDNYSRTNYNMHRVSLKSSATRYQRNSCCSKTKIRAHKIWFPFISTNQLQCKKWNVLLYQEVYFYKRVKNVFFTVLGLGAREHFYSLEQWNQNQISIGNKINLEYIWKFCILKLHFIPLKQLEKRCYSKAAIGGIRSANNRTRKYSYILQHMSDGHCYKIY